MSDPIGWKMGNRLGPDGVEPKARVRRSKAPRVVRKATVCREVELPARTKYPWVDMEVDDSFFAPEHIRTTPQFGGRVKEGERVFRRAHGLTPRFELRQLHRPVGEPTVLVTRVE